MKTNKKQKAFIDFVVQRQLEKQLSKDRLNQWPPTPTLLTCPDDLRAAFNGGLDNRDHWTKSDWQAYALHLEESGKQFAERLTKAEALRLLAEHRLKRTVPAKPDTKPGIKPNDPSENKTLLTGKPAHPQTDRPKRGRPPKDFESIDRLIDRAANIQRGSNKTISNEQALTMACRKLALSPDCIDKIVTPATINRMSRLAPKRKSSHEK
ncbi:hypothetical protein [Methylotuvimicrobium sp.]|uniref:hypothetical protein n=1 Tax=Methylotuvimicrobium sp. TaxID=2822413 RepID=UPI003D64DB84